MASALSVLSGPPKIHELAPDAKSYPKGFVPTNFYEKSVEVVDWDWNTKGDRVLFPLGLSNGRRDSRSGRDQWDCYRNVVLVVLMSLPEFCNFIDKHHNSAVACDDDCICCALMQLLQIYYPACSGKTTIRMDREISRMRACKDTSKILASIDQACEKVRVVRGNGPGAQKGWYKLRDKSGIWGEQAGHQPAHSYMQWILDTIIKQGSQYGDSNPETLKSMFLLRHQDKTTCYITSTPVLTVTLPSATTTNHSIDTAISSAAGTIISLPSILTVHIARPTRDPRASSSSPSTAITKSEADLLFTDGLSLTDFQGNEALYKLVAIVLHGGSADKGHHLAGVRAPKGGWYLVDDENSDEVGKQGLTLLMKSVDEFSPRPMRYVPVLLTYVKARW